MARKRKRETIASRESKTRSEEIILHSSRVYQHKSVKTKKKSSAKIFDYWPASPRHDSILAFRPFPRALLVCFHVTCSVLSAPAKSSAHNPRCRTSVARWHRHTAGDLAPISGSKQPAKFWDRSAKRSLASLPFVTAARWQATCAPTETAAVDRPSTAPLRLRLRSRRGAGVQGAASDDRTGGVSGTRGCDGTHEGRGSGGSSRGGGGLTWRALTWRFPVDELDQRELGARGGACGG